MAALAAIAPACFCGMPAAAIVAVAPACFCEMPAAAIVADIEDADTLHIHDGYPCDHPLFDLGPFYQLIPSLIRRNTRHAYQATQYIE